MKKSGRSKRLFLFILTAAMILTMQDFPVLAGQVPLEGQPEILSVQPDGQPEQPGEAPEQPSEQTGEPPEGGNGTSDGSQEGT
ncbi:MAG: hypothetical protein K2H40_16670, partial [Lachnospiraceae bacterium]|nr:hypothetical protein [Lachnospiraceae bacterium]